MGTPEGLCQALESGAAGVQVGTVFAFCDESGLAPEVKADVLRGVADGTASVRTDPRASPTGYPFKLVQLQKHQALGAKRERICDLGYLREAVKRDDGRIHYRCAAEPIDTYVKKGGTVADTEGRRCLCNGLLADIGLAQERDDVAEPPIVTSGDDIASLTQLAKDGRYSAADVIEWIGSGIPARV